MSALAICRHLTLPQQRGHTNSPESLRFSLLSQVISYDGHILTIIWDEKYNVCSHGSTKH